MGRKEGKRGLREGKKRKDIVKNKVNNRIREERRGRGSVGV